MTGRVGKSAAQKSICYANSSTIMSCYALPWHLLPLLKTVDNASLAGPPLGKCGMTPIFGCFHHYFLVELRL